MIHEAADIEFNRDQEVFKSQRRCSYTQCWLDVVPASATLAQHQASIG